MMVGAIIGTIAIVLLVIVVGLLVDRKVPVLPKPEVPEPKTLPATHLAGEAPATALRVGGPQLDKVRSSQRCPSCRAAMHPGPEDTVRYDEADLVVLHFTCPSCDARRTLYVAPRGGN
jgi:hypothetical protein